MKRMLKEPEAIEEWHRWFAWYPVFTLDGWMVWLEDVERKWAEGMFGGWWSYRRAKK